MFGEQESYDERLRLVLRWLAQEFVALDYRIGLEGLGLLHFRLVQPGRWDPPPALQAPPWNLSRTEAWDLLVVLLSTLRQQVHLPSKRRSTRQRLRAAERRALRARVCWRYASGVWLAAQAPEYWRVDFLARLLQQRAGLPAAQAQKVAGETLAGIWRYLTWQRLTLAQRPGHRAAGSLV